MKSVMNYERGRAEITVHFPAGKAVCVFCPYCVRDNWNYQRQVCFITGEILSASEGGRSECCPLEFEEVI